MELFEFEGDNRKRSSPTTAGTGSIVQQCVICRRQAPKPNPQMMGQLPTEWIMPDIVFENVGLDYAGPLYLKRGSVRKPTILKSLCVCLRVDVCKSSPSGTGLWSHHRILHSLPAKIHCQKRKAYVNMEWPRHQLCGCQSCAEGTTCAPTLKSNYTRFLLNSRYRLAFYPWTCTSLGRFVGSSREKFQDSFGESSWKF